MTRCNSGCAVTVRGWYTTSPGEGNSRDRLPTTTPPSPRPPHGLTTCAHQDFPRRFGDYCLRDIDKTLPVSRSTASRAGLLNIKRASPSFACSFNSTDWLLDSLLRRHRRGNKQTNDSEHSTIRSNTEQYDATIANEYELVPLSRRQQHPATSLHSRPNSHTSSFLSRYTISRCSSPHRHVSCLLPPPSYHLRRNPSGHRIPSKRNSWPVNTQLLKANSHYPHKTHRIE